jgi:hypothetical protein
VVNDTPLATFLASMPLDLERWRDGIGYDLQAVHEASTAERAQIERLMLQLSPTTWREVEVLALLDTPAAHTALREVARGGDADAVAAVTRCAPQLLSSHAHTDALVRAVEQAEPFGGLSAMLDAVLVHHPPRVLDALWGALHTADGVTAANVAALLCHLHGRADSPLALEHRATWLLFNDPEVPREYAVRRLREVLGLVEM